jgi:chemotaxis protein MotB
MMDEQNGPPIIIVKKKGGHGGHHGGAWKVAYADFVTAMMALFIVLWLLSTSEQTKKAISAYFQDPSGHGKQIGSTMAGNSESLGLTKDDMAQIRKKIEEAMRRAPDFAALKDHISITVTGEGLRIELLETKKGMFFESGKAQPSPSGEDLLTRLAAELGKMPNRILIEGHTDSQPFTSRAEYSNWELSSDRANGARRIMQESGLRPDQVSSVRGFADQQLRNKTDAKDPSNRRITVIVQYLSSDSQAPEATEKPKAEGAKKGEQKPDQKADPKNAPKGEQKPEQKADPKNQPKGDQKTPLPVQKPSPAGKKT